MRSTTQKLQAGYARKRETENQRYERTDEVNRYYDHWGKVTTRFQNWTKPEYYKEAENLLNQSKEKELKDKVLNVKRQKLKSLLEEEKISYENELKFIMERNSSNLMLKKRNLAVNSVDTISTDVLEKIDKNFKSEERRRLELEAKLYNQWRNPTINCNYIGGSSGVNSARSNLDENIFLASKTDNEAMAKLNWLDKQIENQMRREQEQKETEMRNLRLQEQARQREETLCERQKIRESEIKELRAIQESHVHELKQRELEAKNLQEDEIHLKNILDSLKSQLISLNERNENQNVQIPPHNVKKIKMIFRQCSEYYRAEIKKDIECLSCISIIFGTNDENLQNLLKRFQSKLEIEDKNQYNIELMYESEAKQILNKWNEIWRQELLERHIKLKDFLNKRKIDYELQLNENLDRQKKLIAIREKHLSGVENSNDKLKILIKENNTGGIGQDLENECDNNNVPLISLNEKLDSRCSSRLSCGQYSHGRCQDSVAAILNSSGNCDNNNSEANKCETDFNRNNLLDLKVAQKFNKYCNIGAPLSELCVPKFGKKKIAWI